MVVHVFILTRTSETFLYEIVSHFTFDLLQQLQHHHLYTYT